MICGEQTLLDYQEDEHRARVLRCRSWQCEYCQPLRLAELRALALAGEPRLFLTLTARRRPHSYAELAARRLVTAWRLVRQHLRRNGWKEKIEFLAVFEETKAGFPHLHILLRSGYIPQKEIAKLMNRYMGSPNVWIEKVRDQQAAAGYIAKYISKSPVRYAGTKRYWRSQGWAPNWRNDRPVADRAYPPYRSLVGLGEIKRDHICAGWVIKEESDERMVAVPGGTAVTVGHETVDLILDRIRDHLITQAQAGMLA